MPNLTRLTLHPTGEKTKPAAVRCIVEAPRGAQAKLRYDPEIECFVIGKELPAGMIYPFDWGFFPSTLAEDGDPLDVMILHDAPSAPGVVVEARIIGALDVMQRDAGETKAVRNDRLFAVPIASHRQDELTDVSQLPQRTRTEIEAFFEQLARLDDKQIEIGPWHGPRAAQRRLKEAAARFQKRS